MKVVSTTAARANIYQLIDKAATLRKPACVTGKWGHTVLLSGEDWLGVNRMRESVLEGLSIPLDQCKEEPGW